jgi:hypothetical protein
MFKHIAHQQDIKCLPVDGMKITKVEFHSRLSNSMSFPKLGRLRRDIKAD